MQGSAGLPPSSAAAAATTAAIHEYVCLFTHDLVRKQKRWQDGRLKYHTHNNRIVVHDDRGNSVGDHHWVSDYAFDEGEEFRLDRGSVIVQVNECVGTRLQDLSELVDKRAKERDERRSAALSKKPIMPRPPASGLPNPNRSLQQQSTFKSLQQVVGTPTGHHGRAFIPNESPFEQRQKQAEAASDDPSPPAKRQRQAPSPPSKKGYAKSLFGATLSLSSQPQSSAPLRVRHVNTFAVRQEPPPTFPSSPPVELEKPTSDRIEQSQNFRAPIKPIATGSMSAQARGALPSLLSSRPQEIPVSIAKKKTRSRKLLISQGDQDEVSTERPRKANLASNGRRLVELHETLDRDLTRSGQDPQIIQPNDIIEIQSSNECHPPPAAASHKAKKREKKSMPAEDTFEDDAIMEAQSWNEARLHPAAPTGKTIKRDKKSKPAISITEDAVPNVSDENAAERPKPRQHKKTSQVSAKPSPSILVAEDEQPKTELRIKPRKKRGLLMLSREGSATSQPAKSKSTEPPGDAVGDGVQEAGMVSSGNPGLLSERPVIPKKRRVAGKSKSTPFLLSEDDEPSFSSKDDEAIVHHKSKSASNEFPALTKKRNRKATPNPASMAQEPEDASVPEDIPKSKRRRKVVEKAAEIAADLENLSGANDSSLDLLDEMDMDLQWPSESTTAVEKVKSTSGPRLARFARKDIRSKEIIGFDFEDEDNVSNFNSFTAASFVTHAKEAAPMATHALNTPVAEADETHSLLNTNDSVDIVEDPSAPLSKVTARNHETISISTPVTAPAKEVSGDQYIVVSPSIDARMEKKIHVSMEESPKTVSHSTKVDETTQGEDAAKESKVDIKITQVVNKTAVSPVSETTWVNSALFVNKQSKEPSRRNRKHLHDLRTESPTVKNQDFLERKHAEGAEEKITEPHVRPEVERSEMVSNLDEGTLVPQTTLSTFENAMIPSQIRRTTEVNSNGWRLPTKQQNVVATPEPAQSENIAAISQRHGGGKVDKALRAAVSPVLNQASLSAVVDQKRPIDPVSEPTANTEKNTVAQTEITMIPGLSNVSNLKTKTRTFSRSKSMPMAEGATTKSHKLTLSRQSSAAAKIATENVDSVFATAEATMTGSIPSLLQQDSAAGENSTEDRPSISTARLVNPATRGRKAAKPSDAAGQTPQCPLPPESLMSTVGGLGRLRGAAARPFKSPATIPVSKVAPLPVPAPAFTTASGSPWSREAFDLFEYQRPG